MLESRRLNNMKIFAGSIGRTQLDINTLQYRDNPCHPVMERKRQEGDFGARNKTDGRSEASQPA